MILLECDLNLAQKAIELGYTVSTTSKLNLDSKAPFLNSIPSDASNTKHVFLVNVFKSAKEYSDSYKLMVDQCNKDGLFFHFCRLKNYKLASTAIDSLVDNATGYSDTIHREYLEFLEEFIFMPHFQNMFLKQVEEMS